MAFVTIKPNADLFAKNPLSIAMESVQINEVTTQIENEFEIYELDKITADGNAMENYSNQLNMELKHASNIKSVLHSSIASPSSLQFAIECATIYLNGFNRRHSSVLGNIPALPALESSSSLSMKTNHAIALEGVIGDAISAIIDGISKVLKWITDSIKKLLGLDSKGGSGGSSDSAKEAADKLKEAVENWNSDLPKWQSNMKERAEVSKRYHEILKSITGPVPSMEVEFYSLNDPDRDAHNQKITVSLLFYRHSLNDAMNRLGKDFKLEKIKLKVSVSPDDYKYIQEYLSDFDDEDDDGNNEEQAQNAQLAEGLKPEQYGTTFVTEGDKIASIAKDIVEMAEKVTPEENVAEVKKIVDDVIESPDPIKVKLSSYVLAMLRCSSLAKNKLNNILTLLNELRRLYGVGALGRLSNGDAKGASQEIFRAISSKKSFDLPNGWKGTYSIEALEQLGYLPLNIFGGDDNNLDTLYWTIQRLVTGTIAPPGDADYDASEMTMKSKSPTNENEYAIQSKQYMKDGAFAFHVTKNQPKFYSDGYPEKLIAENVAKNRIVDEEDFSAALSAFNTDDLSSTMDQITGHLDYFNSQLEHFKGDRGKVFEDTATELNTLIDKLDNAEKLKINISNFKPNVDFCKAVVQAMAIVNVTDLYAKHIRLRDMFGSMVNKLIERPVIDVVKTPEVKEVKTAIKGSKRRKKKKK